VSRIKGDKSHWQRYIEGPTGPDGTPCWIWTGYVHERGYGRVTINGERRKVHRLSWLELRGEIPEGLTIDHLCEQKLCCNPWHMDVVPASVNTRRRWDREFDSDRTCRRGHPRTDENTYTRPNGARECAECRWLLRPAQRVS